MKRDYELYAMFILISIGVLVLLYTSLGFFGVGFVKTGKYLNYNNLNPVSIGTTDSGDVSIELIPKGRINGNLVIGASFNTHSVDLSQFNLREITTLEYDGKTAKPISIPTLSGHHTNGDFVFDIGKDVRQFTIKIRGIPRINERVFRW